MAFRNAPLGRIALRKRHYTITPEGLRALNNAKAAIDRLWAGLHAPLKGTT
jgi:hypothetical protein